MSKLAALTPQQWEEVYAERERWLERGLSTDRADRAVVEEAVAQIYAAAGYARPQMVWTESPLSAALMAEKCAQDQLVSPLWNQLRRLESRLRTQFWCQLRGQLGYQLRERLEFQLRGQFADQLEDKLLEELATQLLDQVDNHPGSYWKIRRRITLSGQNLHVTAFFTTLRDLGHVSCRSDESHLLDAFTAAICGCTSLAFHARKCFLSDRPTVIRMVGRYERARLHCADGPAIEFADGWAVHAWRGVGVPASLVTGEGWTVEQIMAQPNVEIRRCAIERMGWDRFVTAAGLIPVDSHPDLGNPGYRLDLYDLPGEPSPFE